MDNIKLIIIQGKDALEEAEVYIDGFIDNKNYRFLLDTGAAKTYIKYDDYSKNFECIGQNNSSGVFAARNDEIINIPKIEIGPIVKENVPVVRFNNTDMNLKNAIGMDILKDYRLHFSFKQKNLIVNNSYVKNEILHELEIGEKYHPYINVYIKKVNAKAVWDSGASITLVDINFIKNNPESFTKVGSSEGIDFTGGKLITPMYIMKNCSIGGYKFIKHKIVGVDLSHVNHSTEIPMDMILGYSTLTKADWYFDFPNKKWAITKLHKKDF